MHCLLTIRCLLYSVFFMLFLRFFLLNYLNLSLLCCYLFFLFFLSLQFFLFFMFWLIFIIWKAIPPTGWLLFFLFCLNRRLGFYLLRLLELLCLRLYYSTSSLLNYLIGLWALKRDLALKWNLALHRNLRIHRHLIIRNYWLCLRILLKLLKWLTLLVSNSLRRRLWVRNLLLINWLLVHYIF